MSQTIDLERACHDLDFDVGKSLRYHSYRRNWWARLDRLNQVCSTLSGGTVLAGYLGQVPWLAKTAAFAVAVFGSLDLIFDFADHERLHENLYRRFSTLAAEIADVSVSPTASGYAKLRRFRFEIEADEPNTNTWLERRCSKEEAEARGLEVNPIWEQTFSRSVISRLIFWKSPGTRQG